MKRKPITDARLTIDRSPPIAEGLGTCEGGSGAGLASRDASQRASSPGRGPHARPRLRSPSRVADQPALRTRTGPASSPTHRDPSNATMAFGATAASAAIPHDPRLRPRPARRALRPRPRQGAPHRGNPTGSGPTERRADARLAVRPRPRPPRDHMTRFVAVVIHDRADRIRPNDDDSARRPRRPLRLTLSSSPIITDRDPHLTEPRAVPPPSPRVGWPPRRFLSAPVSRRAEASSLSLGLWWLGARRARARAAPPTPGPSWA